MSDQQPMREALRRQAEQLGGPAHPLGLADVKDRARRIRRRRRMVSALAAAAVLAVAVPAGIAVDDRVTGTRDPGLAATSTPGPTEAPAQPGVLTTHVQGRSSGPGIPYLYDGAINLPDGSRVPVEGDYDQVAALGDGWVAAGRDSGGDGEVTLLDSSGAVTDTYPSTGSLAVTADGTVVVFATPDGRLMTLTAGQEPVEMKRPDRVPGVLAPRGVIGSDTCAEGSEGGGCTVFYDDQTSRTGSYVTSHGIGSQLGKLLSIGGVSADGEVSGVVSSNDDGSCSAVLKDWNRPAWRTCDYTLGQFSPDGRYVLGHPAYRDGLGDTSLAILDAATGTVRARLRSDADSPAYVSAAVWDADGTVLATVHEDDTWSLMRLTADGALTSAAPGELSGGDETRPPLHFAARP